MEGVHMHRTALRILLLCPIVLTFAVAQVSAQVAHTTNAPDQIGPYAIGHTSYMLTNVEAGNRPVFLSLWYPADPNAISQSNAPAEYLTDPYTGTTNMPATHSGDWEAIGYDPAFENVKPSKDGPFPLLVVSPGRTGDYWQLTFLGTRIASHGYVVGALEHWTDCQWSWGPCEGVIANAVYRPRDISFAITQLENMSQQRGGPLYHLIDHNRIVAGGYSLGGYAAYALAAGDKLVCDSLWAGTVGFDTFPYPPETCVPTAVDPRIKATITLDGAAWFLHYRELSNIGVPTLIIGEGVDAFGAGWGPDLRDTNARAHAAIDRSDSYRVDVDGTNHASFGDQCDAMRVWHNLGWMSDSDLDSILSSPMCAVPTSSADVHAAVTKYAIAFLDVYFGHPDNIDRWILTPDYALTHSPTVEFFNDEGCKASVPDHTYFKYRPYQTPETCEVAPRDPSWFFASK